MYRKLIYCLLVFLFWLLPVPPPVPSGSSVPSLPLVPRSLPCPRSPRFSGGLVLPVLLVPSRLSPSSSAFYPPLLP